MAVMQNSLGYMWVVYGKFFIALIVVVGSIFIHHVRCLIIIYCQIMFLSKS